MLERLQAEEALMLTQTLAVGTAKLTEAGREQYFTQLHKALGPESRERPARPKSLEQLAGMAQGTTVLGGA
jgi:hypothetical protein